MSLNIKSQRTVALVRELAARTGTNQTAAVEDAGSGWGTVRGHQAD